MTILTTLALLCSVVRAIEPNCAAEREFVKHNFDKEYVRPVRAVFERAFALMPSDKRDEAARLRAQLGEDERRLAAVTLADPKMTEILSPDREAGRRAFDTMRAVKAEQQRYKNEINKLQWKLHAIITAYVAHNLEYLNGVAAEARKNGVVMTIDRKPWDYKNITVAKDVSPAEGDEAGHRVTQSFWTRAEEPRVEVTGSERARRDFAAKDFTPDAYADASLSAACRPAGADRHLVNLVEHHGPFRDGAAVVKAGNEAAH